MPIRGRGRAMGVMVFAIGILRRRAAGMRTTSLAQMLRASASRLVARQACRSSNWRLLKARWVLVSSLDEVERIAI